MKGSDSRMSILSKVQKQIWTFFGRAWRRMALKVRVIFTFWTSAVRGGVMLRQEHLFVVRIWKESDLGGSASGWRGLAQHIASGQQIYFTSLRDMNDFITLKSGLPTPPENDEDLTSLLS